MARTRNTSARKTPTNLSVRRDLVERARKLKLNLSEIFEEALESALRKAESNAWLDRNKSALESYNKHIREHGLFSDEWRKF